MNKLVIVLMVVMSMQCVPVFFVWAGEREVTLDSLPVVVQETIKRECGPNMLKDIEEQTKGGKIIYEADWFMDEKEVKIKVSPDGKVLWRGREDAEEADPEAWARLSENNKGDKGQQWTDSFDLSKCTLTSTGKNAYFNLEPGYQLVLEDDEERLEITVLNEIRMIGNVETRIVEERETEKGELKEISRNFFAFCPSTGSVFYFGEETDNYKGGKTVRGNDSWLAGENDAKPGLMMPGLPLIGARYYQEIAPGVALDRAEIVSLSDSFDTPAGQFEHCLKTEEGSALEPGKEFKRYAPGIGLIQDEDLRLTKYGFVEK